MESLRDMLIRHEGWKNKPYICPAGHKTIGVGFNLDAHVLPEYIATHLRVYGEITDSMVEDLLSISIEAVTNQCRGIWHDFYTYPEIKRNALCDLIFNMGAGKIQKGFPSFVRAVSAKDWQRAADEIKYSNGQKKDKLSDYWLQLHGDEGRPGEIYRMLVEEG